MKKSRRSRLLVILVVVILLIFFQSIGLFNPLKNWLVKLIIPIQSTFYKWGLSFTNFANYQSLVLENNRLREEMARLSIDYIKLSSLEAENEYLQKELGFLKEKDYQYQLTSVIGHLPLNEQIIIIDKGSNSGLEKDQPATVNQGVIVGKLIKVEESRSFVELLTDTKSQLAVTLSNLAGTNGLVKGQVGSSLVMDLIPQDKEVKEGDLVISSGLEEKIPRELLVGEVTQVDQVVGQIFKQARVSPPFNYQNLQTLTIIKSF